MCSFFVVWYVRQGFLHFIPFDLCYKMQISWGQGQIIAFFKLEREFIFSRLSHLFLTISGLTLVFKAWSC